MSEEKIRTEDSTDESLLGTEELEALAGGVAEADAKHSKESARK